jgi:hypothetical protein
MGSPQIALRCGGHHLSLIIELRYAGSGLDEI